ncbi:MAG: ABC transporter permease, partial [Roseovarius sp.]
MIPTIPTPRALNVIWTGYVALFFIYLTLPLLVVATFAFNDSQFPSLPWEGFTLDWFFGDSDPKIGVFHERSILGAIGTSAIVGASVA